MSKNKQSSVEILEDFLLQHCNPTICNIEWSDFKLAIEQAKAMHKEEHGQTWDKSMENFEARGRNEMRAWVDFDEYYNETYESNS